VVGDVTRRLGYDLESIPPSNTIVGPNVEFVNNLKEKENLIENFKVEIQNKLKEKKNMKIIL
jgi:hypothetical protein